MIFCDLVLKNIGNVLLVYEPVKLARIEACSIHPPIHGGNSRLLKSPPENLPISEISGWSLCYSE